MVAHPRAAGRHGHRLSRDPRLGAGPSAVFAMRFSRPRGHQLQNRTEIAYNGFRRRGDMTDRAQVQGRALARLRLRRIRSPLLVKVAISSVGEAARSPIWSPRRRTSTSTPCAASRRPWSEALNVVDIERRADADQPLHRPVPRPDRPGLSTPTATAAGAGRTTRCTRPTSPSIRPSACGTPSAPCIRC